MKQSLLMLLILLTCCSVALPAQDDAFVKTVDTINAKLKKWAEGGASVYVIAKTNGDISIRTVTNQFLRFNLYDLTITDENSISSENGIEFVSCDKKAHAPLARINFYTPQEHVAFIRLLCNTPVSELESICKAFLHLKLLCTQKPV